MEGIKIILFVLLFFTIFILFLLSVNFSNTDREKYQNNDLDSLGLIDINIDEDTLFREHDDNSYGKSLKYDYTRYNKSNKLRSNMRGSKY